MRQIQRRPNTMPGMSKPLLFAGWMLLGGEWKLREVDPQNRSLYQLLHWLQTQQERQQGMYFRHHSMMNDFFRIINYLYFIIFLLLSLIMPRKLLIFF